MEARRDRKVVGFAYGGADLAGAGSAGGMKVAKDSALRGITIPVHPGASRVLTKHPCEGDVSCPSRAIWRIR